MHGTHQLVRLVGAAGASCNACGLQPALHLLWLCCRAWPMRSMWYLTTTRPHPVPLQGVAYALYVVSNNYLYNATRLATLVVGGSLALAGAVTAEQLTAFCFYAEFLASALLSVCDQWGPIMEVRGGCVPCWLAASHGYMQAKRGFDSPPMCDSTAGWSQPMPWEGMAFGAASVGC